MIYNAEQLMSMDAAAISGCSQTHIKNVIADLIETAKVNLVDANRYRYIRDEETLDQVIWDALEGIGSDTPEGYRRGMDRAVDAALAGKS